MKYRVFQSIGMSSNANNFFDFQYLGRLVLVTRKCLQGLRKLNIKKVINI